MYNDRGITAASDILKTIKIKSLLFSFTPNEIIILIRSKKKIIMFRFFSPPLLLITHHHPIVCSNRPTEHQLEIMLINQRLQVIDFIRAKCSSHRECG